MAQRHNSATVNEMVVGLNPIQGYEIFNILFPAAGNEAKNCRKFRLSAGRFPLPTL